MIRQVPVPAVMTATLTELSRDIASGALTAKTLLAECLTQIAAHEARGASLSALIAMNPAAEETALALDEERRHGRLRGPLHGIPIVIKDNIDMAGAATSSGNVALAHSCALRDAEAVRRLRAAGAILVAKTNLSEFSFEIRSRSSLRGDVRNPFDGRVTSGGSSGGTAAAVAAGFAIGGLGTDTGGSLRVPASYTGLVGLRPSQGLVDMRGVAPLAPSTDTLGPIGRSVEDAAILLNALTGSDPEPLVRLGDHPLMQVRVGVLRQAFGEEPAIVELIDATLRRMQAAGAILVDPIEIPTSELPAGRAQHIVDWEFRGAFDRYLLENFRPGSAPASLREIFESGEYLPEYREVLARRLAIATTDDPLYREILHFHQALSDRLTAIFDDQRLSALVYPASMVLPSSFENPAGGWAPELAACSGRPAITLPIGVSATGLPVGMELLGTPRGEAALLRLAHGIESLGSGRPIPPLDQSTGR